MSIRLGGCVVVFAAASLACVQGAVASEFYGVTTGGGLVRFDMTGHSVTAVASLHVGATSLDSMEELDFDGGGNLWALRDYTDFGTFQQLCQSYRITNPATGSALLGATLGTSGQPYTSLAYGAPGSTFYSVNNINGYLGSLDVNSGAFSPVSGVPNGIRNQVHALAINPVDGQAYGIINEGTPPFGSDDFALIHMNLATGLSTVVGSLGRGSDQFKALRFDSAGNAYTVDWNNGDVYSVNLGTGATTFLFAGGAAAVNTTGLALIVPAPGAAGLLGLAGLAAVRRRRR